MVPDFKGCAVPNLVRWYFHSFESFLCQTLVFSLICVVFVLDVGIFTNFSRRMSKKRNTPLQSRHAVEFGLQICERSAGTRTTVVMTVC